MNAEWIITPFVLIDTLMAQLDHHSHTLAQVPDAEIVTVAVVAIDLRYECWETVEEQCPWALMVIDRFHVIKRATQAWALSSC
jgi:transposase